MTNEREKEIKFDHGCLLPVWAGLSPRDLGCFNQGLIINEEINLIIPQDDPGRRTTRVIVENPFPYLQAEFYDHCLEASDTEEEEEGQKKGGWNGAKRQSLRKSKVHIKDDSASFPKVRIQSRFALDVIEKSCVSKVTYILVSQSIAIYF